MLEKKISADLFHTFKKVAKFLCNKLLYEFFFFNESLEGVFNIF